MVPLSETPDPVFAGEMVGPGVAIDPDPGETTVVSPIAGKVVKVHPHAFVVLGADGVGVLVHLGINTVRLEGKGFEVLRRAGRRRSRRVTRWCAGTRRTITGDGHLHDRAGGGDGPAEGVGPGAGTGLGRGDG